MSEKLLTLEDIKDNKLKELLKNFEKTSNSVYYEERRRGIKSSYDFSLHPLKNKKLILEHALVLLLTKK